MFENLLEQVTKVIQLYKKRGERPSEEATKHALVLPFIHDVLGAHYLDPEEVIPEFTADIGQRKGEKVDYAVCRDGEPIILIECKALYSALDNAATVQLERYVNSRLGVSLGILTNGRHYYFYADLDEPNILDAEPFFSIDLLGLTPESQERLKLFHKDRLDVDAVKEVGRSWKEVAALVRTLEREWVEPSPDYIAHFARPLLKGQRVLTEKIRSEYAGYLKEAHQIFLDRHTGSNPSRHAEIRSRQEKGQSQSENGTSIGIPTDGWQSLTDLDPTDSAPQIVRFEDSSTAEVKNWAHLFRVVAQKLAPKGHFQPENLPHELQKVVREQRPRTKVQWIQLSTGQFIRNHGSASDRLNTTMRMLTACGYDPAKCTVQ